MAETLTAPAPHEVRRVPSMRPETLIARYAHHLTNTPRGEEIAKRHASEQRELDTQYIRAKQNIQEQTKEKVSTVRPLQLSDIRSPAGLAHYIEQSDDRWMQALEQKIGLDSTWKILALTGAHTTVKVLETFVDILKIGEGVGKWANALSNEELSKWEKAWAIANGIGTDGLRALAIAGPVLSKLWQTLENISISDNLFWYKSGNAFYQRWAVGDLSQSNMKNIHKLQENTSFRPKETHISTDELLREHIYLRKFEKELWELKDGDIMGEGTQGIVIRSERERKVYKFPLNTEAETLLKQEMENHQKFFIALDDSNVLLPKNIKVPRLPDAPSSKYQLPYVMESIEGLSLKSVQLRSKYHSFLKNERPEDINFLTDRQLESLLEKKYSIPKSEIDTILEDGVSTLREFFPQKADNLEKILNYLKNKGFVHKDLHSGNLMLDKKGNVYIIDFWNVEVPPTDKLP